MEILVQPQVIPGPLVPKRFADLLDEWGQAPTQFMRADWATGIIGIGMQQGPVAPHTDDRVGHECRVVGWIVESEGHSLCVEGFDPIPLTRGTLYRIHPHVRHWTEAPAGAMIKFFWTAMPAYLPLLEGPVVNVFSRELDDRISLAEKTK